jgi:Tfp pilus assembly protein PilN
MFLMINLLPQEYSSALRSDRFTAILYRWIVSAIAAITGLVLITGVGWIYLDQQAKSLSHNAISQNQQLHDQNLTQVQKSADQLSGNIKIINQVLGKEIRFSDLIQAVGQVMPDGTVLSSLTLNKVSGAIDLSASTKDYSSAAQIAANLSDPKNNIFSKVDIINVNCLNNGTAYPCSATYKALFNNSVPSRFLNVPKDNSQ